MKTSLEQDDEQLLLTIQRASGAPLGGATVPNLCTAMSVTATAIRQRLVRLQSLGLVDRTTIRNGRGRPHHTYHLTDRGQSCLGDNYADLAHLLWTELHAIADVDVRNRVAGRVRDAMVRQYGAGVDGATLNDRFAQLGVSLASRGFSVEVESHPTLPILRENHCPYHELARADAGICQLEQQVFERVLGVPLALTSCCRDGDSCCEFHVA